MSGIIDDLNESRYDNAHIEDSETETSETNHTEMDEDVLQFENTLQPQQRPNRENAGQGISSLEPTFTGKTYDDVKKKIQFLMYEKKHETEKKNTFDVETSIKAYVNVMFTQMQATRGFKLFGERAVAVMIKELKQLEEGPMPGKKVVTAINTDTLSTEDKAKPLNVVNLIKQKRDGTIKGRTCADGSKQKRYLGKDESVASPTVSLVP